MRVLVALACLATLTAALPVKTTVDTTVSNPFVHTTRTELESLFKDFMTTFKKTYQSADEKLHRFAIFVENHHFIKSWNAYNSSTGVELGINQFADMTHSEFNSLYLGYKPPENVQKVIAKASSGPVAPLTCTCNFHVFSKPGEARYCEVFGVGGCYPYSEAIGCVVPHSQECMASRPDHHHHHHHTSPPAPPTPPSGDSVDWVANGAVTSVKQQAQCGSCWSFATVGALEGAIAVKHKKLQSLSEEELVQCDLTDHGCQGGAMPLAYKFIMQQGGIASYSQYPYTVSTAEGVRGSCQRKKMMPIAEFTDSVTGFVEVTQGSEAALKAAVSRNPVAVAIEADQQVFQFYKSGVLKSSAGCGIQLDHGVLVVGYGVDEDGTKFWKVKNSWGASWGDNGYIRLERTDEDGYGTCGIAIAPIYPKLA